MPAYHADTVIRRANVITIDPNRPRAAAVATSDGRYRAWTARINVVCFDH